MADTATSPETDDEDAGRRDFLVLAAGGMGVVGAASFAWPLIDSMNPSAEVLALSTVEVNLEPIAEGQSITIVWQGKPVFIRRRTGDEVASAKKGDAEELRFGVERTDSSFFGVFIVGLFLGFLVYLVFMAP